MKAFATTLFLAATVSANYCYTDGCNCSGEYRQCYPLPRQTLNIPKCCGSSPTSRQAEVTSALNMSKKKCSKYCFAYGAYPKTGCDHMNEACETVTDSLAVELSATKCQKICNTTGAWATTCPNTKRGNSKVCIPGGPAFVTSAPIEEEAHETALIEAEETVQPAPVQDCRSETFYIDESESQYRHSKPATPHRCTTNCHCDGARTCSKYNWCQGTSRPAIQVISEPEETVEITSALRWTKNNCRDFCLARGDYPNLSPCQRKMGEETCASITAQYALLTASLKKDNNWNGNTFVGVDYSGGGNTNCGANCGTSINVNLGL